MATRKKTGAAAPIPKTKKAKETTPRNSELEEAIALDPESPDGYLVYGDWLLEQGDSLGELVAVQAALAKRPKVAKLKAELQKKEKDLLARHTEDSLGPFAKQEHTWTFGFLEGIALAEPTPALYKELLELVAARFLRELDLELVDDDRFADDATRAEGNEAILAALAELGVPRTLRKLSLMAEDGSSYVAAGDISVVYRRLTHVRELVIQTGSVTLGQLDLPALETFFLSARPSKTIFESLAKARWPRLKSLSLGFCDASEHDLPFASLEAALASIPGVTHLGLTDHSVGDELLRALCKWRHLPDLASLDLSGTMISNAGGKVLLDNAKRFQHLESINLGDNELSPSTCKALEKAFDDAVDTEGQGERERYDEISE